WHVEKGDTLYGISRAVYPKNTRLQSQFRKEIIKLNRSVFKKGSGGLYIGAKLKLPAMLKSGAVSRTETKTKTITSKKTKLKKEKIQPLLLTENRWTIQSGDSLYSISKRFFPDSNTRQFKLRQDIYRLNPDVFSPGHNKMEVGYVLIMPDYLVDKTKTDNMVANKAASDDVAEVSSDDGMNTDNNVTVYKAHSRFASKWSFSLGYSEGGDIVQSTQGGRDIGFGSGTHLRFNYDGLWRSRQGYRLSLGYQHDRVTAEPDDSAELNQSYLQLLYLFNGSHSVFGIGATYHDKIVFRSFTGTNGFVRDEYNAATGSVLLYEYKKLFGSQIIGVSYTLLETEKLTDLTKVDFSRSELYMRWAF
ncbi:MAG: LysM peptidoglycan-binding domain-containing protein, partial [Gammaproteobacteria bacterium]|nr:LysM peptidoglycan-binding domain-containing protein [Gammaproteobacteria bacterium]